MCLGAPGPLWADKEGQIRQLSGPNASHAEGLPRGARGGKSAGSGWTLSLYPRDGWQGKAPFSAESEVADRAAQVAWKDQGKKMKN